MQKPRITIYGAPWCPYCVRAKRFLTEKRTPFDWIDIDDNPEVSPFLEKVNDGNHTIPTVAVGEGATAALMLRGFLEKTQGSRGYKGDE